jgi:hypothetical protein
MIEEEGYAYLDDILSEFESTGIIYPKKEIQTVVVFEKGECNIGGYFEGKRLYLRSMNCKPQNIGLGRSTLKFLKEEFGGDLRIVPYQIKPEAAKFWTQMHEEGLVV